MRNLFKRITPVILAMMLILCVGFTTACNDEDPDPTVYTVKVYYPDKTAVDGNDGWADGEALSVMVQFCEVDANHVVGVCYAPVVLGSDGTVTIDPAKLAGTDYTGEYKVAILNPPQGYTVDNVYVSATPQTVKIELKAA